MCPSPTGPISAIITAYDCARYLGQAIESVLAQSHPVQQVIVIDDGSTDDCAGVVRAYGNRVQYFRQDNRGTGAARNAGLRRAAGDWLALLDGDDYWEPNKLAEQLAAAAADVSLEAVFTYMQPFVSPDLDPTEAARLRVETEPMPGYGASTMLIQRAAFERIGEFAEHLHISEFMEWYGRAMEAGLRTQMLSAILAWRRVHANNSTRRNLDRRHEYARVLKSMLDRRRSAQTPDDL